MLRAVYGVPELLERALAPILHYVAEYPRLTNRTRTPAKALGPALRRPGARATLAALKRRIEDKAAAR